MFSKNKMHEIRFLICLLMRALEQLSALQLEGHDIYSYNLKGQPYLKPSRELLVLPHHGA